MRIKPPDIDKITPVSLKIKVRCTEVTDLKEFLARKKLEQEKKCKVLPTTRAETVVGGGITLPTSSKPNTGGESSAANCGISAVSAVHKAVQ